MQNSSVEDIKVPATTAGQRRALLVVVGLSLMMVVSAVSGLNVALPELARDTGATQRELTWIVDAYTVVFAGLLLSVGALGDRWGRKGVLLAGLLLFGAAAGAAMLTDDPETLIVLRALMGIGAAAVMPVTLSVITTSFPEEERGHAVGVWVGIAGGGAVIGLLGSGVLLEFFSWSSFFGLNVTLAALAFAGAVLVVPPGRDPHPPRWDIAGAVLSLLGVGGLVLGIIEGSTRGWTDLVTVTGLAVGVLALVAFVLAELRAPQPMLDPRLFRLRGFSAGTLSLTVQFFGAFGFFFVVLQYLQFVVGRSPLEAAVALLPLPFVLIPVARHAPAVAARLGFGRVGATGLLLIASGLAVISQVDVELDYLHFAAGLVLFAAGMGLAGTPATTAITESLPQEKQGVASAVNDTSRELGSALGIALLGSLLNSGYRSGMQESVAGLPPEVAGRAEESIAFVQSGVADRLGPAGDGLVTAAQQAFVDGVGTALLTAAVIVVAAAVVVLLRAPRAPRAPR